MSARDVLLAWSHDTIQHAAYAGPDAYGQRSYAAPVARKARIDYSTRLVRDLLGEEVVSTTQVYIATEAAMGVLDRFTLPDGSMPPPLRVDRLADVNGVYWCAAVYF